MLKDQKGGFFGTVSTVPYNHATPAAFISHNPDRNSSTTKINFLFFAQRRTPVRLYKLLPYYTY